MKEGHGPFLSLSKYYIEIRRELISFTNPFCRGAEAPFGNKSSYLKHQGNAGRYRGMKASENLAMREARGITFRDWGTPWDMRGIRRKGPVRRQGRDRFVGASLALARFGHPQGMPLPLFSRPVMQVL